MKRVNSKPNKLTRLLRKVYWCLFVFLPPRRDATIETENGTLTFDSKDRTIGRELHVHRHFEFYIMMDYVKKLRELGYLDENRSGAVLDIGGNIGMTSIAFLREGIFEKGVTFEPFPNTFRILKKNIEQNELSDRLIAHNVALSDRNGEMTLEMNHKNFGDFRIRPAGPPVPGDPIYKEDEWETTRIFAKTFDDSINEGIGVDPNEIKLIWIDIQGHEGQFLNGAKQFLKKHKNVPVIMEFWPYGILRSGMSKEIFCTIVQELFSQVCLYNEINSKSKSTKLIRDYFDIYPEGSHIILMNTLQNIPRAIVSEVWPSADD